MNNKARPLSVWLLKEGYDETSSLVPDHGLTQDVSATKLPTDSKLYVADAKSNIPWWRDYLGSARDLKQQLEGALLFIPAAKRLFVVTFGNMINHIRPEAYEYDFGLLISLNCVDPNRLRNTDTAEPGAARRQRTQSSVASDITFFDVERDTHVLRSLTGAAKEEYRGFIKNVTGASQVRFSTSEASSGLPTLCRKLLELYNKTDYRTSFPDINNVRPVKDPTTVAALNEQLMISLRSKSKDPHLALPEITDFAAYGFYRYTGSGNSGLYEEITIDGYYEYLKSKGIKRKKISFDDMASHRILVLDDTEFQRASYALKRCLIFDTGLPGRDEHFHLIDGSWFAIEKSYIKRIRSELKPLFSTNDYPAMLNGHEADYNEVLSKHVGGACLDKTNVSPSGSTQVEPCDVVATDKTGRLLLSHVKLGTASADLSHLFFQGQNSTTLILGEDVATKKLKELIEKKSPSADVAKVMVDALSNDRLAVEYVIVTRKEAAGGVKNLPLFSQLSLARSARAFRALKIPVAVGFVKDKRPKVKAKPKTRKGSTANVTFTGA